MSDPSEDITPTPEERALHAGTIAWFARNPVAANLLMLILLVCGIYSIFTIEKKTMPDFELDVVNVEVAYPGATPEEVERGIIIKIEEEIEEIEGIKQIISTASENIGLVAIEVAHGHDLAVVMDEVNFKVNAIFTFPEETEKPVISRASTEEDQVIYVQIYGDLDEKAMTELFDRIRDELVLLPEVTRAVVEDARDYEISIELSESLLQQYGLTFEQVATAIRAESLDLPGGVIRSESADFRLRTRAQAYTGADFREITLRSSADGALVRLGDVATVVDGFVEDERFPRFDGKPSISMIVKSIAGQNDLEVTRAVRDFVERKNAELPDSVRIAWWGDASPYLKGRIKLMLVNLGAGAVLVFILLGFFLQLRLAFWVIIGIPVAFCGALWLMPVVGITVNMISLFGFILVLGIVVDDAIVIGENIHTTVQRDGPGRLNVIRGAKEVAMPATFGVLTTIVAFIPMTRVTGTFGPIWLSIGGVVILALIFSLVESKWILPAHLLHLEPEDSSHPKGWLDRPRIALDRGLTHFVTRVYQPVLDRALEFRYTTIAIFLGVMMVALSLVASGIVRFVFFPDLPSDFLTSSLVMSPGTPLENTRAELRRIESALYTLEERMEAEGSGRIVEHIRTRLNDRRTAEILVELSKSEERDIDSHRIAALWSEEVGDIPGAQSFSVEASISHGGGAAIDLELTGEDLDRLKAAGERLKQELREYEGVFNVTSSLGEGNPEILLHLRPEAEAKGLTLASVASQIRQGFYGAEAQRIQRGEDEVKVMVRYPAGDRRSLHDLETTRLRTPEGEEIPFGSAVDLVLEQGYSTIQRVDGRRIAKVTAAANKQIAEPGKIAGEVVESFPAEVLAKEFPGITMRLAGQSEQEQESLQELMRGFVFALFCIYALMAIPLRSYIQPLLIMSVIPFGFIGAVIGHLLLGLPFSVLSLCGIIALSGVVVNDSLVMVDFVNRGRRQGLAPAEAAKQAGGRRFRAILLTSLTTFIGLIPIIAERSLQAQIVIPMAVTLAFGILFATFITLLLVPTLYLVAEDVANLVKGKRSAPAPSGESPPRSSSVPEPDLAQP